MDQCKAGGCKPEEHCQDKQCLTTPRWAHVSLQRIFNVWHGAGPANTNFKNRFKTLNRNIFLGPLQGLFLKQGGSGPKGLWILMYNLRLSRFRLGLRSSWMQILK